MSATHDAFRLLGTLRKGETVIFTDGGRDIEVVVQHELRRPTGYGSWDNDAVVTVGFGPGRWNTEVSAGRIVAGFATIRKIPT